MKKLHQDSVEGVDGALDKPEVLTELEYCALQIREHHGRYIAAGRTTLLEALEVGKYLNLAKRHVRHGEWNKWIADSGNFPGSRSTAVHFMRLDKERDKIVSDTNLDDLTIRKALSIAYGKDEESSEEDVVAEPFSQLTIEGELGEVSETEAEVEKPEPVPAENTRNWYEPSREDLEMENEALKQELINARRDMVNSYAVELAEELARHGIEARKTPTLSDLTQQDWLSITSNMRQKRERVSKATIGRVENGLRELRDFHPDEVAGAMWDDSFTGGETEIRQLQDAIEWLSSVIGSLRRYKEPGQLRALRGGEPEV